MKREHLVNPNPSCLGDFPKSSEKLTGKAQANTQAPNLEGQRRVKTSAAMIGLAISMSATGMLFPQRDGQALAADPAQNERTVTLPPMTMEQTGQSARANGSVAEETVDSADFRVAAPAPPAIKHEIEQGDTLWELAENYQVETDAIATSNNISPSTTLPVGKSIKIPVTPQPAAEPSREPAAVVIQVPEPEPLPEVARAETPTVTVEATKEITKETQETAVEKAPVVIPVSTPEPLPSIQATTPPNLEVATAGQSQPTETPIPTIAASPMTVETPSAEIPVQAEPLQPEVAASPSATLQPEANTDEAAVVVPVLTPDNQTDNQAVEDQPEEVIPPYEFIEPEVAVETTESRVQTTAPNPIEFSAQDTYQVQPGDTLDAIARRYGISRTELVQVNRLNNPNLIKVDQQLRIPVTETTVPVSQPRTVAESTPRLNVNAQMETPTERSLEQLQADIEELQQNYGQEVNAGGSPEQEIVEITVTPAFSDNESNNPEWQAAQNEVPLQVEDFQVAPRPTQTERPASTATQRQTAQADIVAAAPISVEAYNPMLQTPVGEMVAPDVPPLSPPEEYLPDSPERFDGYIWPAKGVLTSGYGWRWGRMHKGIDIAAPIGTPIVAAAPGEVISAGWNSGGYGNLVKVKHDDGSITLYAHNNRVLVRRGQKVDQGQQIAEMGSTGYSTGPHLHFEVHPEGNSAQNPMAFLPNRR